MRMFKASPDSLKYRTSENSLVSSLLDVNYVPLYAVHIKNELGIQIGILLGSLKLFPTSLAN